ncbi:MAG: O-Antigen ligase [Parcubacteria group bacterium ADurb.Bin192]|nr:MAG: O-Antigen ligase [Parcubacteria group bacterium ADurb.Bin192]
MEDENGQNKAKNSLSNNWRSLFWVIFLVLFLGSLLVAFGLNLAPFFLVTCLIGILFAWRFTYFTLYLAIFFLPFLGFTVSIPTGSLKFGERAFGGSIDLFLGETILLFVLGAWAIKIFYLWYKRRDSNWQPILPLWQPYLALTGAHLISVFSSYAPDPVMVLKFVLRPVLFCYVAFVVMPVNLIRSRRRLKAVLGILTVVGVLASLNGLLSLASVESIGSFVRRAHPIALFGLSPIGENHNVLAELLLMTGPLSMALAVLAKKDRWKSLLFGLAGLQLLVALMTFARTAWIVFFAQAVFMLATVWRPMVKKYISELLFLIILLIPLALIQIQFSFSHVAQSSNSTRWMLTDIAYQAFLEHPIIGSGAGTYVWRVGSAQVFIQEFGDPLDAHGFWQKLMTETGLLGILTYAWLLLAGVEMIRHTLKFIPKNKQLAAYALVCSAGGAILYQFLNTAYWTAHMWLPVGIMLAGISILRHADRELEPPSLI